VVIVTPPSTDCRSASETPKTATLDGEPTWTPRKAIAVAAFGDGRCLAQSAWPHINLFASPAAATRYLDAHALHGSILSIADAATAGRWLFGDLLHSLDT